MPSVSKIFNHACRLVLLRMYLRIVGQMIVSAVQGLSRPLFAPISRDVIIISTHHGNPQACQNLESSRVRIRLSSQRSGLPAYKHKATLNDNEHKAPLVGCVCFYDSLDCALPLCLYVSLSTILVN